MKSILVVEDQLNDFNKIKNYLNNTGVFKVYPEQEKTTKGDLNSKTGLIEKINICTDTAFDEIYDFYNKKIDLYIVDISTASKSDNNGAKFLKYLQEKKSNNSFIIVSDHNWDNILQTKVSSLGLDVDNKSQYLSKGDLPLLPAKVQDLLKIDNFEIKRKEDVATTREPKADILKRWINNVIMYFFYLLIGLSIFYAAKGILVDEIINGSYKEMNTTHITNADSLFAEAEILQETKSNELDKLVFIEHIFLYLLPLFVILGFYEYYSHTIGVLLSKGNPLDYDPEAIKSLDASKLILLSSLLSFSLIKAIEKIFFFPKPSETTLIAMGVFIIILMVFILLNHKPKSKL